MPEWIKQNDPQVVCKVNDKPRSFIWHGKFIDIGAAKPGETVKVEFPIPIRKVREKIGPGEYELVIKGNTVCSIEPPGKYCPLYQRDRYLKSEMPWRAAKRFVSEQIIDY